MQVPEMRSVINTENRSKGRPELPSTAPDWVIRGIYERRNNLPLSPLPEDLLKRANASREARLQRAVDAIAADESARMKRLRDRYSNLFD